MLYTGVAGELGGDRGRGLSVEKTIGKQCLYPLREYKRKEAVTR